ncbi:hypothetical protein Misp01_28860 [Microtetraspora sp. NBRC 13810]|nr:hypothetical protein Misp01_28860 [Microtetraspora sp. NBRC 13810]
MPMPIPSGDIGVRPAEPATTKPLTPGSLRRGPAAALPFQAPTAWTFRAPAAWGRSAVHGDPGSRFTRNRVNLCDIEYGCGRLTLT